jgi:hypothetical protein
MFFGMSHISDIGRYVRRFIAGRVFRYVVGVASGPSSSTRARVAICSDARSNTHEALAIAFAQP